MRLIARAVGKLSDDKVEAISKRGAWLEPRHRKLDLHVFYFNAKAAQADQIQKLTDTRHPLMSMEYSEEELEQAVSFMLGAGGYFGYLPSDPQARCEVCRSPGPPRRGYKVELERSLPRKRHVLSTTYDRSDVYFATHGVLSLLEEHGIELPEIETVEIIGKTRGVSAADLVQICPKRLDRSLERDLVEMSGFQDVYHPSCGHQTYEFFFRAPMAVQSPEWSTVQGFRQFSTCGAIAGNLALFHPVLIDPKIERVLRLNGVLGSTPKPVFNRDVYIPTFDETPLASLADWKPEKAGW